MTPLNGIVFLSLMNYILCYFMATLTLNGVSIGDRVYHLDWYQLSRNEQFIIQTMIRRAQEPFELNGLRLFVCSLETFLKVRCIDLDLRKRNYSI